MTSTPGKAHCLSKGALPRWITSSSSLPGARSRCSAIMSTLASIPYSTLAASCRPVSRTDMSGGAFSRRIVQSLLDTDFYKLTMMHGGPAQLPQHRGRVGTPLPQQREPDALPHRDSLGDRTLAKTGIADEQLAFLERIPYISRTSYASSACSTSIFVTYRWPSMPPVS